MLEDGYRDSKLGLRRHVAPGRNSTNQAILKLFEQLCDHILAVTEISLS